MNVTVKDVMTTQVVAVRRGAAFKEMAATLRRFRVSAFPVVDENGKVIGVVSEADMLAKEVLGDPGAATRNGMLHHREVRKAEGLTAGDLMTHPAVSVRPEESVENAARLMYTLRIKRLPVVNAGGCLVGVVSRTDVLAVRDRLGYPDVDPIVAGPVLLQETLCAWRRAWCTRCWPTGPRWRSGPPLPAIST